MDSARERAALAERIRARLAAGCPGSSASLRGSLRRGTADEYSDIDLEWVVPDERFRDCVDDVPRLLGTVAPVAAVRAEPELLHSDWRRLLFVRFEDVPLFWRLDLSVRAESAWHEDAGRDPAASAREGEWSRPASAMANAIGAVKASARGHHEELAGLVDRGFDRVGRADRATGEPLADITRLARAAARADASLGELAEEVIALARRHCR